MFADRSWRSEDAPSPADPAPPAAVKPAVLDQALGSVRGHDEAVVIVKAVGGGLAAIKWRTGEVADRSGRLTRYLWLGQIREVEIIPPGQSLALFMQTCALALQTTDGRREIIRGEEAILQEFAAAIRDALAGPHRDALPPPPPPSADTWRR